MSDNYVSPDSLIDAIKFIDKAYEEEAQVQLGRASPSRISIFLGAHDTKKRKQQILFLKGILAMVEPMLFKEAAHRQPSKEELDRHVNALNVLTATALFIRHQICNSYWVRSEENATLVTILDKALGSTSDNQLTKANVTHAMLVAEQYIKANKDFKSTLAGKELKADLVDKFVSHVHAETKAFEKSCEQFPVASLMGPFVAFPFQAAGSATGYLIGDALANSTLMQPTQQAITAALGGSLIYFMGPSARIGVLLFAPSYASQLLRSFSGLTMAQLLGLSMWYVGNSVGFGVGLGVDACYRLLSYAITRMYNAYKGEASLARITGYTLIEPVRIIDGVPTPLEMQTPNHPEYQTMQCTKTDSGLEISINGSKVLIPWTSSDANQSPEAFLQEIKLNPTEAGFEIQLGDDKAFVTWGGGLSSSPTEAPVANLPVYTETIRELLSPKPSPNEEENERLLETSSSCC